MTLSIWYGYAEHKLLHVLSTVYTGISKIKQPFTKSCPDSIAEGT